MSHYYYEYEIGGDYCYPDTNVLKNKLHILNASELIDAERELTALNLLELKISPIPGALDFDHLKAIHQFLFDDIYDWAGKVRTVNIRKGNQFCNCAYIETGARKLFAELKHENYLLGSDLDHFIARISYYLGEINILHPFREGNGRTQRVMVEFVANTAGYEVDFSSVTPDEMLEASALSFDRDYSCMKEMFRRITSSISKEEQFEFLVQMTSKRGPVWIAYHKHSR